MYLDPNNNKLLFRGVMKLAEARIIPTIKLLIRITIGTNLKPLATLLRNGELCDVSDANLDC